MSFCSALAATHCGRRALLRSPIPPFQLQALAKQFAEILHFVLKFDDLKMNNPAIQNDFSYYRRTLSKMKMNNVRVVRRLS